MGDLDILLTKLNVWLVGQKLDLELVIIGAYALQLHGISSHITMDIDALSILPPKILIEIANIGEEFGLPEWLNNQAAGMILPEGFYQRTLTLDKFSNIKLNYASRIDLIKLKVAAYYYRHETEQKDLDDLRALSITQEEFEQGRAFLSESHKPEQEKFVENFEEDVLVVTTKLHSQLFGAT